jgi:hypothetical protein
MQNAYTNALAEKRTSFLLLVRYMVGIFGGIRRLEALSRRREEKVDGGKRIEVVK